MTEYFIVSESRISYRNEAIVIDSLLINLLVKNTPLDNGENKYTVQTLW